MPTLIIVIEFFPDNGHALGRQSILADTITPNKVRQPINKRRTKNEELRTLFRPQSYRQTINLKFQPDRIEQEFEKLIRSCFFNVNLDFLFEINPGRFQFVRVVIKADC